MRKFLVPFLITTLLAAIGAYLNNAYQKHKREEIRKQEAAIEQQEQQQLGRAHTDKDIGRVPLGRDSRDRPDHR
ncbi:MAG TPA: hypothetical protein VN066_10855 [Rhodocyclaceae bacterium]|nr:hypothetical protein [Rhodocyclaceae bacterium]